MKENAGFVIVVPFKFTVEQRRNLIVSGWQTLANREKAKSFIDSSQIIIAKWLTVTKEIQSIADRRHSASKIQKVVKKFILDLNNNIS